jgi:ubiquinone/menaquinone biosynthesis C-methylase UbiE
MLNSYYNQLAPYYKYIYADWDTSLQRQAGMLDSVIHEYFGDKVQHILDAACGIGTQSIGLAKLGYAITASDISPGELEKARREAQERGLKIDFKEADMRNLSALYDDTFDLVIACDNAIPHLLNDDEITQAFREFYRCTKSDGGCLITVRDYESMDRSGKQLFPRTVHETVEGKQVMFDLWEFDGDFYDFTTYVVLDKRDGTAETQVIRGGRYYCVTIPILEKLMGQAGFKKVVTLRERFFQPLTLGMKV